MLRQDHRVRTIICLAVIRGREEEAFATYGCTEWEQAAYRRMADDVLARGAGRWSPARRYFTAPIRNPLNAAVLVASAIGISSFAIALALWRHVDLASRDTLPIMSGVVGFAAIGVAAVGWGVSGWITHRTGRSKLTMDVVSARFSQAAFGDAMASVNKVLKHRRIDGPLIAGMERSDNQDERRAVQGLRYLLNYFEFISVGVLEGELDERIVAKTLRGNLIYIYDLSTIYIAGLQRTYPKTLEHFTALRRHYREL